MKFFILFSFLFLVSGFSCKDSPRQTDPSPTKSESKTGTVNKPPGGFSDTLEINYPAAVFFNPDSLQLEKIKAVSDAMMVESMMHECFYQMRNSRTVLNQIYPEINIIEAKRIRFILFEKASGEKEYIDLDKINEPCGMFIFDGLKKAERVDMTNIETQLGFYFAS